MPFMHSTLLNSLELALLDGRKRRGADIKGKDGQVTQKVFDRGEQVFSRKAKTLV